jgi:hypothetical protein
VPTVIDFYIITDSGLCIYSKSREKKIEQDLFSGFMSALNSFTQQMAKDHIESFSLGSSKYFIRNINNLLFVARTAPTEKDSAVRKELDEIGRIFLTRFPSELFEKGWDNSLSIFSTLNKLLQRFFAEPEEKMRMAIW